MTGSAYSGKDIRLQWYRICVWYCNLVQCLWGTDQSLYESTERKEWGKRRKKGRKVFGQSLYELTGRKKVAERKKTGGRGVISHYMS